MLNNYFGFFSIFYREKQRKLDKMRETQTYIEEFIKEQAIWRKRKQEEMEEENRKIMEFANMQRQREDDWMAKVRDTEEKKQKVQNTVSKSEIVENKCCMYVFVFHLETFPSCNSLPRPWKEKNRGVKNRNKSAKICIWKNKKRWKGRRRW